MLGEKAIKIEPGNSTSYLSPSDTAQGQVAFGLNNLENMVLDLKSKTDKLFSDENLNKLSAILSDLTKTIKRIEQISNHHEDNIGAIIQNVRKSSDMLTENSKNIDEAILNIKTSSTKLDTVAAQLNIVAANIKEITQNISQGKGTIGKIVYSDSLYQKLFNATCKIDSLADDIKKNPQRYLKIRLF